MLLFLSLLFFFQPSSVYAQCPDNGVYMERTPGCNWSTIVLGPGEEWDFVVQNGVTYIWSFLQGGGNANWDTQLTGFYEGPQNVAFYNDDFAANLQSQVTWTSNWTGQIDVLTNRYSCQGGGSAGSATLAYRKVEPAVTINQGTEVNTCDGITSLSAALTYDANNTPDWALIGGSGTITSSGQVSGIPANSSGECSKRWPTMAAVQHQIILQCIIELRRPYQFLEEEPIVGVPF